MKISFCPSGLLFMAFPLLLLEWKRPENRMRTGCFRVIHWVIPHSLEHSNCPINICQRNEWRNERTNNWVSKLLKRLDQVVSLYYPCWPSTLPLSFGSICFSSGCRPCLWSLPFAANLTPSASFVCFKSPATLQKSSFHPSPPLPFYLCWYRRCTLTGSGGSTQ